MKKECENIASQKSIIGSVIRLDGPGNRVNTRT